MKVSSKIAMLAGHSSCQDNKLGKFLHAMHPTLLLIKDSLRKKNVRRKLNAMALEFVNKVVLIVDGEFIDL